MNENAIARILSVIVGVLLFITVWPLVAIWACNTLFPSLAIGFNFWNWLAMTSLGLFFRNWNFNSK